MCKKCLELEKENANLRAKLSEWGISDNPPICIATKSIDNPQYTSPGDKLICRWKDNTAGTNSLSADIPDGLSYVDRVTVYSFSDALGFTNAVMGVFGESGKNE